MYNPEFVLENETHKHLWDFEIQTDHLISARRPDQKKKRACRIADFAVSADHKVKLKESEKKDKYLDLARELKRKTMEHESDGVTNSNWYARYSHQKMVKGMEIKEQVDTIETTAL